jgi:S-adenosylmethionine decarboxylase
MASFQNGGPIRASAFAHTQPRTGPARTQAPLQGIHLLAEWYGCPRRECLRKSERLRTQCLQLAKEAGFDVLSAHFHQFDPQGVMGAVLMVDGHLAIHTWPDTGFVAVDVYACHLNPASRARARCLLDKLRDCLRPVWANCSEISRGVADAA